MSRDADQNQPPKIIKDFDAMFTMRTGLTLLLDKQDIFDDNEAEFEVSDNGDVLIKALGNAVVKGLSKTHIDNSINKGFIMFYEMVDGEVVRNTICRYKV